MPAAPAFRQTGSYFTPAAWIHSAHLEGDLLDAWKRDIPRRDGFDEHPYTWYVSVGPLWSLPGQLDYSRFVDAAKHLYARLILTNLPEWAHTSMTVGVRRENYPGEQLMFWPTLVATFIGHAPWMPVKAAETNLSTTVPLCDAWFYDDNQPDPPPPFAPLIPRAVRRLLEGRPAAVATLRECGLRTWNYDPDAPHLVLALYRLLRDDRVPPTQVALYRRQYEEALQHCLARGAQPWTSHEPVGLVVHRRQLVEALDASNTVETVYVDDGGHPSTTRMLGDFSAPIVCARPADGARLYSTVAAVLPGRVRLLSEVEVEVVVDGVPVPDETTGIELVEPSREWLVELVVAALEFRSSGFRRQTERTLKEAARRLRQIIVVAATELVVSVDGQPAVNTSRLRDALAIPSDVRPLIVLQGYPGEFTWDTLEQIAPALCQTIRYQELDSVLFEALVRLRRSQGTGPPQRPSDEDLAGALNVTVEQLREVTQLLRASMELLAERLHIAIACVRSIDAGLAALPSLSEATSEEALMAILGEAGVADPSHLVDIARRAVTFRDLREELSIGYREFNDVLVALGYTALVDPAAHAQAFQYFIGVHRERILARLRAAFMPHFTSGLDVAGYVARRSLAGLVPLQSWLEICEVPDDQMIAQHVDSWLTEGGAPGLDTDVLDTSVEVVRSDNRRMVSREGETAGRIIRAWCQKSGVACPDPYTVAGCGPVLAHRLDEHGLLDFATLDGLPPILPHLVRLGMWPHGMPATLDAAALGLSQDDLESADTEEERQRRQRELERRTIEIGGRRLFVEPDRFPDIAAAVQERIPAALLGTPLRLATLAAPPPGRPSGGRSTGRSYYRGGTRPTEQQLAAIGLVGEVIALEWLRQRYKDNVVRWRSGYRDKVLGGAEGDDMLGYDIEVITSASTFLFEVKSSVDDGTDFELSETEVNTARLHVSRDAYRIIYVRHALDPSRASILLLPNPFTRSGQETYRIVGSGLHYRFLTA